MQVCTWSDKDDGDDDQSTDDEYDEESDDDAAPVLVVCLSTHQLLRSHTHTGTITGIETIMCTVFTTSCAG